MDDMTSPGRSLSTATKRSADKLALITPTRVTTFRDLDTESDRVAGAVAVRGIRPGRPVSLYAQNRWEWVVSTVRSSWAFRPKSFASPDLSTGVLGIERGLRAAEMCSAAAEFLRARSMHPLVPPPAIGFVSALRTSADLRTRSRPDQVDSCPLQIHRGNG